MTNMAEMNEQDARNASKMMNHNVCERDWFGTELSKMPDDGTSKSMAFKTPTQVQNKSDVCCMCGTPTVSGIYVRMAANDERLLCHGDHEHAENWSPMISAAAMPS